MNKSDFFTADAVKPHFTYDDYCESADMIAAHLGDFRPEVLLVLGSGLGFLGDRVEARTCVSYADIPHFRASTAPGHEGASFSASCAASAWRSCRAACTATRATRWRTPPTPAASSAYSAQRR